MDPSMTLKETKRLLEGARGKVRAFALMERMQSMADRAVRIMVCAASVLFLAHLGALLAGRAFPLAWPAAAAAVLAVTAVMLLPALRRALLWKPSYREAAERLDLGAGRHNRIAIALALLEEGPRTSFAAAAVRDGMAGLVRLKDGPVALESRGRKWTGRALLLLLAAVIIAASDLIEGMAGSLEAHGESAPAVVRTEGAGAHGIPAPRPGSPAVMEPKPPARSGSAGGDQQGRSLNKAGRYPDRGPASSRSLQSGTGWAKPGKPGASSSGLGESTRASSPSESARKGEEESAPANKAGTKPVARPGPAGTEEDSSAVSPGAAGGRLRSPVSHAWSLDISNRPHDAADDESEEEEIEEEKEGSTQRGGVQPLLKDRREAPSRELAISGEQGRPGSGRGGPTPPKKSRGTAHLVLGVPLPDFVRGRPGPGATKVTHERVDSSPTLGGRAAPAEAAPRLRPEGICPRFHPPPGLADLVRRYLVSLHSADRMESSGETAASGKDAMKD